MKSKIENTKLITYKMTDDIGFAPNPFHGVLTLATCKPAIRRSPNIKKGDWISGWSSRTLCGDNVGEEKLIYLAKIREIIPIAEYWENYPEKRNNSKDDKSIESFGDNIYKPDGGNGFIWQKNVHHQEIQKKTDTGGKNVIICEEFYYFGKECKLDIPTRFPIRRPTTKGHRITNINDHQSCKFNSLSPNIFDDFVTFVRNNFDATISNSGKTKEDFIKNIKGVSDSLKSSNSLSCCKK